MNEIPETCRTCTFWDRSKALLKGVRPCKLRSRKRRESGMSNCTVNTTGGDGCGEWRVRPGLMVA